MDTNAAPTDFDSAVRDDDDDDIRGRRGSERIERDAVNWRQRLLGVFRRGHGGYRALGRAAPTTTSRGTLSTAGQALVAMLTASWLNVLLVFVPVGMAAYVLRVRPLAVFATNAVAVIPLSSLLTAATERVARESGDTVGALLNISLGNLVELILFIVALVNNQIRVVQASILGSILVNSLLILGTALLATGVSDNEPIYNTAETQLLSALLFASVFVFLMPTAFSYTFDHTNVSKATLQMSRVSSVMVLLIYLLYFVHELRSRPVHPNGDLSGVDRNSDDALDEDVENADTPSMGMVELAPAAARTIRFADENVADEAVPETATAVAAAAATAASDDRGRCNDFRGQRYMARSRSRTNSHPGRRSRAPSMSGLSSASVAALGGPGLMRSGLAALQIMRENESQGGLGGMGGMGGDDGGSTLSAGVPSPAARGPASDFYMAVLVLVVASGLMSVNAQFLVDTIGAVTHQGHLSESVIGLIILPIVGNIAEYVTVVSVALRDKLDLAISVAIGSSIQIALCVTPLTVGAGWLLQRELSLTFTFFEMAALVGTALLVGLLVSSDGDRKLRTCGLKGALMCACYGIIGFGAYYSPNEDP